MNYVIGSGPAAISAAMALVTRGASVTILDTGKTLEPERQTVLDRLARQPKDQWAAEDLEFLRGGDQKARHGSIHSKQTYGSEYPYEDVGEPLQAARDHSTFNYSQARGGLSNVWGGSLLPSRAEDIADWPITLADLDPHYRAVLDFTPSTEVADELAELLPIFKSPTQPLEPSRQAAEFLQDLRRHRPSLRRAGIHFGRSRMAVAAQGDAQRSACVRCGLCLYGCPHSLIYSSAQTLRQLIDSGRVTYIDQQRVERLVPTSGGVTIHSRDLGSDRMQTFAAERVFVGCGVLPTAWLALNSLEAFDTPIEMLDSQYFIYPFFRLRRTPGVESEELHSLAQAFLEIDDPAISKHLVHLEIFGYSDFLKRALMETPLRFFLRHRFFAEQILERLLVVQGFVHSADSGRLSVVLRKGPDGRPMLEMSAVPSRRALLVSLKAGLKLMANALALRGMPVVPAIQFAEPGRSYHSGGTFPMRRAPGRFETDVLGRLPGLDRVHLVDASVFSSIPATTITFTIMANAHRIATQSLAS